MEIENVVVVVVVVVVLVVFSLIFRHLGRVKLVVIVAVSLLSIILHILDSGRVQYCDPADAFVRPPSSPFYHRLFGH